MFNLTAKNNHPAQPLKFTLSFSHLFSFWESQKRRESEKRPVLLKWHNRVYWFVPGLDTSPAASSHTQSRDNTVVSSALVRGSYLFMAWLFWVRSSYNVLHSCNSRKILYVREHFSDWEYVGWRDSIVESISWATGLCETGFGIYFDLRVHHGQQGADDSSSCQYLGGGRKPCDSHPTTQVKQSCVSLFLTLVLGLSLLHGVKTLRVAQKAKQLPDQNRRWRLKSYAIPTHCIASLPVLGGRHTIPLKVS